MSVRDIYVVSASEREASDIRWDHISRRSAARASRKLGVTLDRYQGRTIQVRPPGWAWIYQHHVAVCSHNDRAAARSGPCRFRDCGSWSPRSCLVSLNVTSMAHLAA
jgi:hypothetical protein